MKSVSHNTIACLLNFDTKEAIDGYSLEEMEDILDLIQSVVNTMKNKDCSGQMLLFYEK